MKPKLIEHFTSIAFVSIVLLLALVFVRTGMNTKKVDGLSKMNMFGDVSFVDGSDQFQKALFRDVVNIYYPDQYDTNAARVNAILAQKENEFSNRLQKSNTEETLSWGKLVQLLFMYLKFILVYVVVMLVTYYGVQTLAVLRFVHKKRNVSRGSYTIVNRITGIATTLGKTVLYFVLFSPAYVVAYSIRTEFNTDTIFFMALLGVVSNGLLITYMNKFYSFLVAESRKGYVDTAIVKNLHNSYAAQSSDGISLKEIVRPRKHFKGHVFDHIFKNARHQYLSTIKEQSSFLITGLIIIEMALNIHSHLSYEMLRQLLYKNYDIVIVIVLGIFYTVKVTEIVVDYIVYRESLTYGNRSL